ncbi:3-hydroxybutyrate dehydrogenase [Pararhizobium mangrovi]|uniref:3-hydroxybutyrate dehydrogenase n=1 Tax=Pararhizobium mangrovi TaxID=2590452 RepID=A0A506U230_9HYPH|nr:3-hydroxybutyrate dehydrogenase [Pararhizobium mangrovi]TPW26629.1 3-hydroxybutyrate dehydrogenase [Pararhizobium mangrovi]
MEKTVVITGSTSGIGLGLAEGFAKADYNVLINGFGDTDAIEKERKRLEGLGEGRVVYHDADMTKPDEIADMIATAEKAFGGIDVLINNAGIQHVEKIESFPIEKWDAIIAINLSSSFHTIRAAMPGMKKAGHGRIINIASAHGLVASPFKVAYVAAKHGILGLTKTVALEVAQQGITVNAICPGYVLTPLVEKQIPDTARERNMTEEEVKRDVILAAQPSKQFIEVEDIAAYALFLASDAAKGTTGAAVTMDGGWTAG